MTENITPEATTATEATEVEKAVEIGYLPTDDRLARTTPADFLSVRTTLKLSRADVEKATGLSGSVVWRSEQDGKTIEDEPKGKLIDFYAKMTEDAAYRESIKPAKKPAPTALQTATSDFSEAVAIAAKAEHKIAEIRTAVEAAIADGKKAKRSTKDLQAILALIDA